MDIEREIPMAVETTSRGLGPESLELLSAAVRGDVIVPSDPRYAEARAVYNAMIDKSPALVVVCRDAGDVIQTVQFARENDLEIAVRGGGHNVAGKATCDGGVVIDLGQMRSVRVDPQARTARVDGGATWGDVDHATHAFGLATPSGIISTTGVAGLTLGGGFGHIARRYGLSCDNLLEADVVTAEGQLVRASEDENPDLFWALRGGGGNFGIVTSFKFRLHPVDTIYGGLIFYPVEDAAETMAFYRDFIQNAPREISAFYSFHIGPPAPFIPEEFQGMPMTAIAACYTGPMERAEQVVKPLREAGKVLIDVLHPMPYPALQSAFDGLYPPGLQHYWKAHNVHELSDEAIQVHAAHGPTLPSLSTTMHFYPLNGAIQDVDPSATAFSYRDALANTNIAGVWPDPSEAERERHVGWVREYWDALLPYSAQGTYVNFMTDEGDERIRAAYRDNYPRLVEVKRKWDPENVFHLNQNIKPT